MKKQFSILTKAVFFLALAFTAMPAFSQSNLLVGTWQLTAADEILPDGGRVSDFGSNPRGIAIFTDDGHYVVEIFRSDDIKFAAADRVKGTPEEYKYAILNASCHFGTYTVDAEKGTITFYIDHANYPNWDETVRVSSFTLKKNNLTWQNPPRPNGAIPLSSFSRMQ